MFNENANRLLEQVMEDQSLLAEIVSLGEPREQLARLVEMAEENRAPVASEEVRTHLRQSLWD